MRSVAFAIRRVRAPVEDVVCTDRQEDGSRVARETSSPTDRDGVDFKRSRQLRLASIRIVKRRRIHQHVGTNPIERLAEPFGIFES